MAFGSKKQAVIAKPSFKEKADWSKNQCLRKHMKMLQILNAEMQADIDSKKQKVKLFEDEIGFISETQKEAQEFMSNLEKFI